MRAVLKAWWRRSRYVDCLMCNREFRKGRGGGLTRETVCSDACWSACLMATFGRER